MTFTRMQTMAEPGDKFGRVDGRGTLGYWATIRSGDHWYMVSVSDMLQPYHDQWWADRMAM